MNKLIEYLNILEREYKHIIDVLKKYKKSNLKGRLEITKNKSVPQYYHTYKDETGKLKKEYIKKENTELIKNLAQKHYNKKLYRYSFELLKLIKQLKIKLKKYKIDSIYANMIPERKKHIDPIIVLREDLIKKWKAEEYQSKGFGDNLNLIYTNKNERVRSKTEKILADLFYSKNIEYKYEKPLQLSRNLVFYPDFTFLSPHTNKEIYWEHFGMMDDENYVNNVIRKIRIYEKYNINLGENLLITFETAKTNLDYDRVNNLIQKHLM